MKIVLGYATKEGQSRKIARWVSDRLFEAGHSVEVLALGDAEGLDLKRFDRAILVGPVHAGHYPKPLVEFAGLHATGLGALATLFLSVSLAAGGMMPRTGEGWIGS